MLEFVRSRRSGLLGELPTVFAFDRTEQAFEINERVLAWFGAEKARPDPLSQLF